ncbi:aconitase family protein, partial [Sphingomonadaceae bacterium G21617-S1]|nr:aconitase family protein [Sphingomonadaceae bacterium G21617-S1]
SHSIPLPETESDQRSPCKPNLFRVSLGALTMIFPYDDRLSDYLSGRARETYEPVAPDDDANYFSVLDYDLSTIEQLVSGPHEIELVRPLRDVAGLEVSAANIGSCSSGRLTDLALAAEVLRGRKVHPGVRLVVTPISAETAREAAAQGLLQIFLDAGAMITQPGCGACYSGNLSPLKLNDGERCISTSVETLRGRMGSREAEILLANAAVVAASAIEGRISDPGKYLAGAGMEMVP